MVKKQTNLKRAVKEHGADSIVELVKKNSAGADGYAITDPSERLMATIGTCTNEPKFYSTDPGTQVMGYKYSVKDCDEQAQLVINTAFEVAESSTPKDLVQIAHWARKELRMRTVPQILLAIAGHCEKTKKYTREYVPKIVNRADELKQAFIAERSLFGHEKSLPNAFKRGLSDAFTKFKEYDFLKYEGQGRPHFGDVLKMADRAKDWPLVDSLAIFLRTGEVTNPEQTPLAAARQQLSKMKEFSKEAKGLALEGKATWEFLTSQFGNKTEVWEFLIEHDQLGYMALMRNLRNILQAEVSKKTLDKVTTKLVDGALHSKQLPFRFLMAQTTLREECKGRPGLAAVLYALGQATKVIAEAGHKIPGKTCSAVDTSGSMQRPISEWSKMQIVGAASMLAGMFHTISDKGSVVGIFADSWKTLEAGGEDPLAISNNINNSIGKVGHGTNVESILQWALKNSEKFDRFVIFSDCQTYGANYGGKGVQQLWTEYKQKVNPNAKLHTIDLAGHGVAMTQQSDTSVNLVNGYSDKLFDIILRFEGIDPESGKANEEKQEFNLEYIRKNY